MDENLLKLACQQDGRALSIATWVGSTEPHERLWHDRRFLLRTVIPNGGGNLLKDAPLSLQLDPELVTAALGARACA